jgi:hypothetical protein
VALTGPESTRAATREDLALTRCFLQDPDDIAQTVVVRWHELRGHLRRVGSAEAPRGPRHILVLLEITGNTQLGRLVSWAVAVSRLRRTTSRLRTRGLEVQGRYGVYPTFANPGIVYSLRGQAARYTSQYLLSEPAHGAAARVRSALTALTGCATSVGGFVVVTRQP